MKPAHASEPARVITAMTPVKGNPSRWNIRVGKQRVAILADHEVADLGLHVNLHWSDELAEDVRLAIERRKARTKALRMLGRKACTHGEIMAGLEKAKFTTDLAREVADELVDQGWIDEAQIAMDAARALAQRIVVREAIVERLLARKIDEMVAEDAARAALAGANNVDRAADEINRKLKPAVSAPTRREIRRVVGSLARKGVDAEDVAAAFRRCGIDLHGDGEDGSMHDGP